MALIKRLKNNSGVDKFIITRVIPTGTYYFVEYKYWVQVLDDVDLMADVASGQVVVNDNTSDLSAAAGKLWLERFQPDPSAIQPNYKIDDTFTFFRDGKSDDKWLMAFQKHAKASNSMPIVIPFNGAIQYMSMMNEEDSANGDLHIYKNGILIFTWNFTNKKWAKISTGLSALTFNANDQISMYIKKTSGEKLEDLQIVIGLQYNATNSEDTGGSTL